MKTLVASLIIVGLASFSSCQKQQTEDERKAEIDREVQARLAAERQTQQQQELEQRRADLDAREKALAEKEQTPNPTTQVESTPRPTPYEVPRAPDPGSSGSYSMFYTKLAPYGDWIETSDYGYVWHPSEAERSRNWRPYTNGRWVYSDVGWMWVSEEPFGWAAYHYGRWTRLRGVGWVWVPGERWAPAWVSWRKSNDYVGWAPLPPEARFEERSGIRNWADNYYDIGPDQYSFLPTRQFGTQRVASVIVTPEQNLTIMNQTVNVTNITYDNTTVVNHGPDYDELQRQTQQPIERVRVERRTNMNLETETLRTVVKGGVVEVPAPIIGKTQAAAPPSRLKQKIAKVTVERGWEGVRDARAAETLRAKMKAESTPPPDAPPRTFVKPVGVSTESAAPPPASTMTPRAPVAPIATTPSTMAPTASPLSKPSAPPHTTAIATPPSHSLRPVGTPSPGVRPGMTRPPAPAKTAASPVGSKPPVRHSPGPVHSAVSTPPTTPSPPAKAILSPIGSASPGASSSPPAERREPGERTNQTRKSATQQSELREVMPATTPEVSSPRTSFEPPARAAADHKQQEKEISREEHGRRKGPQKNESPTPSGKPE